MEVSFSKSFYRSVAKINDQKLLGKIEGVILKAKRVNQVSEIDNIKKLVGFKNAYRVRIGDYRIGIIYENYIITFAVFGNRKDIYKYFP
ncbi:type II toxin-antitoxin system RelE/ParE family toxin [soil metagenome]